jgi:hypothetical protein
MERLPTPDRNPAATGELLDVSWEKGSVATVRVLDSKHRDMHTH